jgi:hypothetical protein
LRFEKNEKRLATKATQIINGQCEKQQRRRRETATAEIVGYRYHQQ